MDQGIPDCRMDGYWHSGMRPGCCSLSPSSIACTFSRKYWLFCGFYREQSACVAAPAVASISLEWMQHGDRAVLCRTTEGICSRNASPETVSGYIVSLGARNLSRQAKCLRQLELIFWASTATRATPRCSGTAPSLRVNCVAYELLRSR